MKQLKEFTLEELSQKEQEYRVQIAEATKAKMPFTMYKGAVEQYVNAIKHNPVERTEQIDALLLQIAEVLPAEVIGGIKTNPYEQKRVRSGLRVVNGEYLSQNYVSALFEALQENENNAQDQIEHLELRLQKVVAEISRRAEIAARVLQRQNDIQTKKSVSIRVPGVFKLRFWVWWRSIVARFNSPRAQSWLVKIDTNINTLLNTIKIPRSPEMTDDGMQFGLDRTHMSYDLLKDRIADDVSSWDFESSEASDMSQQEAFIQAAQQETERQLAEARRFIQEEAEEREREARIADRIAQFRMRADFDPNYLQRRGGMVEEDLVGVDSSSSSEDDADLLAVFEENAVTL